MEAQHLCKGKHLMDENTRLDLTEEEAFALLTLSMLSEGKLDKTSERALNKLADYCRSKINCHHSTAKACEFTEAG